MQGFECSDVRVFRGHDLLREPQPSRQIIKLVHRTVVLELIRLTNRGEERRDDQATLHRCRHLPRFRRKIDVQTVSNSARSNRRHDTHFSRSRNHVATLESFHRVECNKTEDRSPRLNDQMRPSLIAVRILTFGRRCTLIYVTVRCLDIRQRDFVSTVTTFAALSPFSHLPKPSLRDHLLLVSPLRTHCTGYLNIYSVSSTMQTRRHTRERGVG